MAKGKSDDTLAPYRSRRDFRKTREPSGRGKQGRPKLKKRGNPLFVIQQSPFRTEPRSVLTGRTLEDVAEEEGADEKDRAAAVPRATSSS